ncbi:MAG: energy-coupling factor transporter transmembrane component T [Bacillota bacterium]|nr:energy-coupling factor transporter transmembrane component T [Bacillota bacterium]
MNSSFGYVPRNSFVHRRHPLVKMAWVAAVFVLAMAFNTAPFLAAVFASVLFVAGLAGVLRPLVPALAGLAVFASILVFFQAVFTEGGRVLFHLLPWFKALSVTDHGLVLGLAMALRMMTIVTSFLALLATTEIKDIVAVLVNNFKVPYDYALMFSTALRFVPSFMDEARRITEAQRARGYAVEGANPVRRLRAFAPVAVPLVLLSLARAERLAVALETRGYGRGRRVALRREPVPAGDRLLIVAVLLAAAAGVAVRVTGYGTI